MYRLPVFVLILLGLIILGKDAVAAPLSAKNITQVGRIEIAGGGMVDVAGRIAAVGHMGPPFATTLLDVGDPSRPRILSRIKTRPGTHSHKARICGDTLAINVECYSGSGPGGLALFDIADPARPREVAFHPMGGTGAHRFQFDCARKMIYASGGAEGFEGNITLILDVFDPSQPREVGRWWLPGQNVAAGEKPAAGAVRTHHPLRLNDRLYVPLWFAGFAIVDIADPARPALVSHVNYDAGRSSPTHTALPVAHQIAGRRWLIIVDEELGGGSPPAFMRLFDITDERQPLQAATFQVPEDPTGITGGRFGAHQPHEGVGPDSLVYIAWFSGGLRIVDISDPWRPKEAGHYIPRPAAGQAFTQSNDVFVAADGLIYLIDRISGLSILRHRQNPHPSPAAAARPR